MAGGTIFTKAFTRARTTLSGVSVGLIRQYYISVWGMKIGKGTRISSTAKLDKTHPTGVDIGEYTAITFEATVLTHDFYNLKHKTTKIGSYCLIGARSIIMPGIRIGDHCVIGAGAVVMTNVPPNSLVLGNPGRIIERGIHTTRWGIRQEAHEAALVADRIRAGNSTLGAKDEI